MRRPGSLKLLVLAAALAGASAQPYQSGILYWCGLSENGANGANPRSLYSPGTSDVNYACHTGGAQTDGSGPYNLTNGATDLSPSSCYVSIGDAMSIPISDRSRVNGLT